MADAPVFYAGPDRRGVLDVGASWIGPVLVVVFAVAGTVLLRGADGAGSMEHALALHSLSAAMLGVLFLLCWGRWWWFDDARAAHLGFVALGLSILCGVLLFGHSIDPLWDERVTRAFLVAGAVLVAVGRSRSARAPEVDADLRSSRMTVGAVLVFGLAALVAYPTVAGLATDTVTGGIGAALLVGGLAAMFEGRRRPMFSWMMAAVVLVGLDQLVHLLPGDHEQADLLLIHLVGLVICVIGSLGSVHRSFLNSVTRGSVASLGREEARRSRASEKRAAQIRDHELRNAVLALDGATSVAMSRAVSGDELAPVRVAVASELARLRRLLDQDLARAAESVDFDLLTVLRDQVTLAWCSDCDIRLHTPATVRALGDPGETAEIVQNLLRNADCHAHSDAGIDVFVDIADDVVDVTVADRGPGIAPELRQSILTGPVPSKIGSGLGLHICATIARRRGGGLSLHDRPGGGAMVRYRLLRTADAAARTSAPLKTA